MYNIQIPDEDVLNPEIVKKVALLNKNQILSLFLRAVSKKHGIAEDLILSTSDRKIRTRRCRAELLFLMKANGMIYNRIIEITGISRNCVVNSIKFHEKNYGGNSQQLLRRRLRPEQVIEVRRLTAKIRDNPSRNYRKIGKMYGISASAVRKIHDRESWPDI